ncbi:hypothetical protein BH24ACT13_BH24ACT13_15500 [soil metagenome]
MTGSWLAAPAPAFVGALEAEKVAPGWLGLVVVVLLAIATALLLRSMITHLRRVPLSFDDEGSADPPADGSSQADPPR